MDHKAHRLIAICVITITLCFTSLIIGYHLIDGKSTGCPDGQAQLSNSGDSQVCYPVVAVEVNR